MKESGYYPMGAEFDPSAPWNEREQEPKEYPCEVHCLLTKVTEVATTDYCQEEPEPWNGIYGCCTDLSAVDWEQDYKSQNQELTTVLERMADLLQQWMPNDLPARERMEAECLIATAKGWEIEELIVEKV